MKLSNALTFCLKMIRLTMNFIALEDRAYHGLELFDQIN